MLTLKGVSSIIQICGMAFFSLVQFPPDMVTGLQIQPGTYLIQNAQCELYLAQGNDSAGAPQGKLSCLSLQRFSFWLTYCCSKFLQFRAKLQIHRETVG